MTPTDYAIEHHILSTPFDGLTDQQKAAYQLYRNSMLLMGFTPATASLEARIKIAEDAIRAAKAERDRASDSR